MRISIGNIFRFVGDEYFNWKHRNDRIEWEPRWSGMVPGRDCPWRAGDEYKIISPSGKVKARGKASPALAKALNHSFRWK